jgi:5'-nucleotidase
MKIILSNDDGFQAPGLNCLAEALSEIAETFIVAPDRNLSGASNSLTLDRPIRVNKVNEHCYALNGTPTDCVHLAVTGLLAEQLPDMVVSGINSTPNLGDDVMHSGTVAAALTGRSLGLPSIAISLAAPLESQAVHVHYETAAICAKVLVTFLKNKQMDANTILNINVPDLPLNEIKGFSVTRLGARACAQAPLKQFDPRGRDVYWIGLPGCERDLSEDSDFMAVQNGYVSITPIRLEWTNYQEVVQVSSWINPLNANLKAETTPENICGYGATTESVQTRFNMSDIQNSELKEKAKQADAKKDKKHAAKPVPAKATSAAKKKGK